MCEQCRTETTDVVEILTAPKAASLAVDAPKAETVDTVDTLRTTLANVVANTGAEIGNLTTEVESFKAGGRLAAEVVAEIARHLGTRLDANSYDFGNSYGTGARELVVETTGRLRGRVGVQDSVMVSLVEWLLPHQWREAFVANLADDLREQVRDEVREELSDEIRDEIEQEIRDEVRDEVREALSSVGSLIDEIETAASTIRDEVDGI